MSSTYFFFRLGAGCALGLCAAGFAVVAVAVVAVVALGVVAVVALGIEPTGIARHGTTPGTFGACRPA